MLPLFFRFLTILRMLLTGTHQINMVKALGPSLAAGDGFFLERMRTNSPGSLQLHFGLTVRSKFFTTLTDFPFIGRTMFNDFGCR